MNQVAQDQLGWTIGELRGRSVHAILHGSRLDGTALPVEECPIRRARQDGELVRVEDDVFLRKDGRELPVAYTAAPFSTGVGIEGCVVLFEDITERKAEALRVGRDLEKLTWLERIQEALTEKRFVLYAQPIIDLKTGAVVQREMLLRMRDAHHSDATPSVVLPGAFLPVAEEFGLITQIDHWVIDRSTEIAATGQAVEINVSGRSVSDPSLVGYINHAIERAGADPTTIVFEITETTLASDEVAARAFVEGLHSLGCKVALDDFGTGYGGFTYLKQLPIDFLKIDIEFVPRSAEQLGQPARRRGDRQPRRRVRPQDGRRRRRGPGDARPAAGARGRLRPRVPHRSAGSVRDRGPAPPRLRRR